MNKIISDKIPSNIQIFLQKYNSIGFRPIQIKSIEKGLFENNKNQVISAPTASGKTLIAELAMLNCLLNKNKKVIYIVPLKALASEKFQEFRNNYSERFKIRLSVGELQTEKYNYNYDILIVTTEKLDSIIRHNKNILDNLGLVIADEIHLLNDEKRGPTLEVLLSIFKSKYPKIRLIGLSATIGNAKEIAKWLNAILIEDEWRPVELHQCILDGNEIRRYK
ncbi:MAG: DEAD/DEAH box helicase [Nanoarchaeota archaeon]